MTCYHSKARHDRFDELLDVLTDMFLNSRFDPVEIDKERSVIKEELAMYLDQPQHRVQEMLNETLWPDQPLGRPLTGTEKTLDGLTRSRLVNYQRDNYVAGRTIIRRRGAVASIGRWCRPFRGWRRDFPQARAPQFVPAIVSQTAAPACGCSPRKRSRRNGAGHPRLLAARPAPLRVAPAQHACWAKT